MPFGAAQAEVGEDITGASRRTGRRARFEDTNDVPRVKDADRRESDGEFRALSLKM